MLPPDTFAGRVAFITGGGTGLGLAMARYLAAHGADLVLCARNAERLAAAAAELRASGWRVLALPADIREPEQVQVAFDQAVADFGRLDLLVNNAAGNFVCRAEDLSPNGWQAVVGTVLNGTFICTRAAGRHWIRAGSGGAVLNIVSTAAWTAEPGTVHSAAAKAGIIALTRSLAVEWAPYRIRINCLAPGPIAGTGAEKLWPDAATQERLARASPTRLFGTPAEMAHLAAYLLSDHAAYVNGEVVTLDGGAWLNQGGYPLPPSRWAAGED